MVLWTMPKGIPNLDKCLRVNKDKEKDGKEIIPNKFDLTVGIYGAMMIMENRRSAVLKSTDHSSPRDQAVEMFESGKATAEELEQFKLCGASSKNLDKYVEQLKSEELREEVDTYCYSDSDEGDPTPWGVGYGTSEENE